MTKLEALASGAVGACALTLVHQVARKLAPAAAPRMDELGMRAIEKGLLTAGAEPPGREALYPITLSGDLAANTLYYSLVGVNDGRSAWLMGTLLGLAAGVGGVLLPGPLGLGEEPSRRTRATEAMTVAWYLIGGLAAAATAQAMRERDGGR